MSELISPRDTYGKTLLELGRENPRIVVLDADLSKSTRTVIFAKEFPDRFFDFGVSEGNMIGTAAGFAISGKIPFCSTFSVFATGRAYDQIRQSIAYPKLDVKIVATHGGLTVGEDGASHQTTEDVGIMRGMPNMTVIVPADAVETEYAVRAAVRFKGPVFIRLGREAVPVIYNVETIRELPYKFEIGKGVRIKEGKDLAIIACGIMVKKAIDAAEILKKEGLEVEVINIHTIKPIDKEMIIETANKVKAIITCEEHNIINGLGSAVAEVLGENKPLPMQRMGMKDCFGQSGSPNDLLKYYGLETEDIIKCALMMNKGVSHHRG